MGFFPALSSVADRYCRRRRFFASRLRPGLFSHPSPPASSSSSSTLPPPPFSFSTPPSTSYSAAAAASSLPSTSATSSSSSTSAAASAFSFTAALPRPCFHRSPFSSGKPRDPLSFLFHRRPSSSSSPPPAPPRLPLTARQHPLLLPPPHALLVLPPLLSFQGVKTIRRLLLSPLLLPPWPRTEDGRRTMGRRKRFFFMADRLG